MLDFKFPLDLNLSDLDFGVDDLQNGDPRLYRVHLLVEELSEVVQALEHCDEVALANGLADLVYVAFGCAHTFGIPLMTVIEEVHRSNMTKARRDVRLRDKGDNWEPPKIAEAIERGRSEYNEDGVT